MTRTVPEHALLRYAAALRFDDLSEDDRLRLKLLVLDTLAIAIGAAQRDLPSARIAGAVAAADLGGAGPATLWADGTMATAPAAALVNGTLAEILDYQEVLIEGRNNGHATVVLVPALLALAERQGSSGPALLTALAAALEINFAVLRCLGRAHRTEGRGIRTTALGAPIGGAVAGALLLGADDEALGHALGIAAGALPMGLLASMAPVNGTYAMDKDLAVGLSAQHAVLSALFAAAGLTGTPSAITGGRGLVATVGFGDAAALTAPADGAPNLHRYAIKRFPVNFGAQAAVRAALELRAEAGLRPEDIRAVRIAVKTSSADSLSTRRITTHVAARFSLPFAVASALVRGDCRLDDFEGSAIADPAVLGFMDRIKVVGEPSLEARHRTEGIFPAEVTLETAAGPLRRALDGPWDGLDTAAMAEAVRAKARELLTARWPAARADRLIAAVDTLDRADDVRAVTAVLR